MTKLTPEKIRKAFDILHFDPLIIKSKEHLISLMKKSEISPYGYTVAELTEEQIDSVADRFYNDPMYQNTKNTIILHGE